MTEREDVQPVGDNILYGAVPQGLRYADQMVKTKLILSELP